MSFRSAASEAAISSENRDGRVNDIAFRIDAGASPIAEFTMMPGQAVAWDAGSILMADAGLKLSRSPGRGQDMALVVNASKTAVARLQAGSRRGGPLGAFDLGHHGGRLLFARHALAGAGPGVAINRYGRIGRQAASDDQPGLTMLLAEGDGWLFLSAAGRVIERRLASGEAVTVGIFQIVAMTATVDVDDAADATAIGSLAANLARLTGPGRVWLQAVAVPQVSAVLAAPARAPRPALRPVLDVVR
jgi:uncharacterized protein (AIM24 family)